MWPFRTKNKKLIASGTLSYTYTSIFSSDEAKGYLTAFLYEDNRGNRSFKYDDKNSIAVPRLRGDLVIWKETGIFPHWVTKISDLRGGI
jgi:hypothetical protein